MQQSWFAASPDDAVGLKFGRTLASTSLTPAVHYRGLESGCVIVVVSATALAKTYSANSLDSEIDPTVSFLRRRGFDQGEGVTLPKSFHQDFTFPDAERAAFRLRLQVGLRIHSQPPICIQLAVPSERVVLAQ
jgi:hypothetical protein